MDVTHCFKGWKLSRPYASLFGFGHVLNLATLDCGITLYLAKRRGVKKGLPLTLVHMIIDFGLSPFLHLPFDIAGVAVCYLVGTSMIRGPGDLQEMNVNG